MQHIHKKTSFVLALLSGISILTGAAAPAHAITLMDILRGGPGKRDSETQTSARAKPEAAPSERMLADPEPLPKVSAPQYYTYKADAERAVKTAGFAAASSPEALRSLADARVSAPADIAAALEAYYVKAQAPLWVSAGDVNDKARAVLSLFERAGEYGLNPDDYMLSPPSLITASVETAPAASAENAVPANAAAPTEVAPAAGTAPEEGAASAADQAAPANAVVATDAGAPAAAAVATDAAAPANGAAVLSHDKDLMQFELAMSAKVLLFAQDMVRGRVDANRLSGYHDIKRRDMNLSVVLPLAEQDADAAAYLEGLAPQSAHFKALKAELARLQAEAANAGEAIALPQSLLLKPGNSSEELPKIVAVIEKRGSDALKTQHAATLASYAKTPDYTPDLVDVVKAFQSEVGLKADGVIGAATLRKMAGHTPKDKIEKVVVAMEQARWLPDDLGARHVFINQPAFRVYYHEHGAEQFSMRVVVGSKAHQTFFFQDKIETVEFNPYWGVPQSIIVNEMVPHLRRDPSYLDRQGYEVAVNGKTVPSSSVNWYGSTQNISVRQPPSSDNALGDLKILFPNAHAIYMHDTPSKSFFQRDMRALSHGCVRLAEPRKMAAAILGTTVQDVDARIAAGKNVPAKVTADIPVYVAYFTAWPNKDGVVEYFDDVYGRDTAVEKAFEATTKARAARS